LKPAILLTAFLFFVLCAGAQMCTTLGQTPSTAFPVCGTASFSQSNVPICSSNSLFVPGCTGTGSANYANKNPFFYKFTCYTSGTLAFEITPNDLTDDYDWQLYDVTGLDPNEIFTNHNIVVTGNWAGNPGKTGASASGVSYIQCASGYTGNEPRFSKMPNIIEGHEYILMVSHFTDSQSGYSLTFSGGTASITDPKMPALETASASCDASKIIIKLNKKMKCSSLASNGSDFTISAGSTVVAAGSVLCNTGFDMDSLVLSLSNPLAPGNYTITIKNGTDGNTLVDNCDRNIPVGNSLPLVILPLQPTPMDSLTPVQCAPNTFELVFRKNILCSSIAADGSDFIIAGPSPVSVISAKGNCVNGASNSILINLNTAIVNGGNYQIVLKKGSDGNTIIDECAQETPAGSAINFSVKDTVSANFTYQLSEGCKTDVLQFSHDGKNGVNKWLWQLDYNGASNLQSPKTSFSSFGTKQISLLVSNGFCSDSITKTIDLGLQMKADFETKNTICPEDPATFINKSVGDISSYSWDFGNGNSDETITPPDQHYPLSETEKSYSVQLTVANQKGCKDTAVQTLKVLKSCYIAVPNAFTPNDDGLNDFLYPLNAFKADNLEFQVYNRLGQLVFSTKDWTKKWDGKIKGEPQSSGVFVWTLKYTHHDTGKKFFLKGSTVLIR
jgi:gliding motility-associated-like protein